MAVDTVRFSMKKKLKALLSNIVDQRTNPVEDSDYEPVTYAEQRRYEIGKVFDVAERNILELRKELLDDTDKIASRGQTTFIDGKVHEPVNEESLEETDDADEVVEESDEDISDVEEEDDEDEELDDEDDNEEYDDVEVE